MKNKTHQPLGRAVKPLRLLLLHWGFSNELYLFLLVFHQQHFLRPNMLIGSSTQYLWVHAIQQGTIYLDSL